MKNTKFKNIKVSLTEDVIGKMYEFYSSYRSTLNYPEDVGNDGGTTQDEYELIQATCSLIELINRCIVDSNPKLLNTEIKPYGGKEYKIINSHGELDY